MRFLILLLCTFLLISTPIFANDLESSLLEFNMKKKEMITSSLQLTDSQSEAFWKVYEGYEKELDSIIKEEFELIQKYNTKHKDNSISEQSASNMSAQNFRIEGRETQIKQIYLGKFQEVLPKNVVLRFYLLDNKINALLDNEIEEVMSLAGAEF
jgi:hypothetical protein